MSGQGWQHGVGRTPTPSSVCGSGTAPPERQTMLGGGASPGRQGTKRVAWERPPQAVPSALATCSPHDPTGCAIATENFVMSVFVLVIGY